MLTISAEEQLARFGPGGGMYRIVTKAADTGGLIFALEATEPPGGGPPLHTHAGEEEYFAVLEGEITFFIDGNVRTVGAGGSAFVPRGLPHSFKNCSERVARVLVVFTPGSIEGFFNYGLPVGPGGNERPSDEHLMNRIAELGPRFGLELLGASPL